MIKGEQLYNEFREQGIKVCIDDRSYSIGEKIKDNELFGIKCIVIIGNSFLQNGKFEFENRKDGIKYTLSENEIIELLKQTRI